MNKIKAYGTQGYELMIQPLPKVIKRAVVTYWMSVVVGMIVDWIFKRLSKL